MSDPETEDQFYEVEAITDYRFNKGKHEFRVKWLEFPEDKNSWEPLSNLDCPFRIFEHFRNKYNQNCNSIETQTDANDGARESFISIFEHRGTPISNEKEKFNSANPRISFEIIKIDINTQKAEISFGGSNQHLELDLSALIKISPSKVNQYLLDHPNNDNQK